MEQEPIKWPEITIPGRGTFPVKFSLGAAYTLEDLTGLDEPQFARALQKWLPKKDAEGNEIAGEVSKVFLFKVLSACLWDQVHMTPRELADAFETWDGLPLIAAAIAEAFSKTRWSAKVRLQEPATSQEPRPPVN